MRGKLYSLNVFINYYYYFRSRLHYSTIVICVNFFELKSGLLFWRVVVNWWGSNLHFKHLNCCKSHEEEKKKTGSSEELSVSVYSTMVFSNKMMKCLFFSQCQWGSQFLSSDSETAITRILYVVHDTTPLTHRAKRKTNGLYFYIAVFFHFNNHRHYTM